MTNRASRLIGSAIIIVGGGVTLALGELARAIKQGLGYSEGIGGILVVVGLALFLIDWVDSWQEDRTARTPRESAS